MDVQADFRYEVKRNLVADVMRCFGQVQLEVVGTSMLPSVWPGDIVTVNRCNPADLLPGQIVLCFCDQGPLVVHRLAGKIDNCFLTRGDSVRHYDRPFGEDEILGQTVTIVRDGRQVDLNPAWWHGAACFLLRRSELCIRLLLRWKRLVDSRRRLPAEAAGERMAVKV